MYPVDPIVFNTTYYMLIEYYNIYLLLLTIHLKTSLSINNTQKNACLFINTYNITINKPLMADFNGKEFVDNLVKNHSITVISKSTCPYCIKAINTLNSYNPKDMHVEQIESHPNMVAIQDYLQKYTGTRTVPKVFIGGMYYGDCSITVSNHNNGALKPVLEAARAI